MIPRVLRQFYQTTPSGIASSKPKDSDVLQHLQFIQSLINRLDSSSATLKGWLIPVVTASYGFAYVNHNVLVLLLGMFFVVMCYVLDSSYLFYGRRYVDLYNAVILRDGSIPWMSLDWKNIPEPYRRSRLSAFGSRLLLLFYVPIFAVGVGVAVLILS